MTNRTPPRGRPAAVWVALVIELLLIALAVVAVRDLAVSQGWAAGTPWSTSLLSRLDGLTASTVVVVVAVLVGLLGLVVVWKSVKPGRRTHLRANVGDDLWLTRGAVAALAQNIADRAPGVISADATTRGRKVSLDVVTGQEPGEVRARVQEALDHQLKGLTRARFTVKVVEVPR